MKKTLLIPLAATLLSSAIHADTITLRADVWHPFNGEPDASRPGYMIEIAKQAFESAGHKLDYQLMDWDETLEHVAAGKIDCAVGIGKEEAPDFIYPDTPLGVDDTGFYTLIDNKDWNYRGAESLRKVRIGVVEDYSYDGGSIDQYIQTAGKTDKIFVAGGDNPLEDLINKLIKKDIDVVLESPAVFRYKAKKMGFHIMFEEKHRLNDPTPIYIACSPKNKNSKQYTKLLSKTVTELRKNGGLKKILSRYGVKDWQ